jgi:hypothetical protein
MKNTHGSIILSRPKVKKWIWERDWTGGHNLVVRTKEPMTEEDVRKIWNGDAWRRVEGTEIEVEE